MTERESLIVLSSYVSFGPVRIKLLINYFGSAKKSWKATRDNLQKTGLTKKLVDGFIKYRMQFNSQAYFLRLNRLSIKTITYRDSYYPKNLVDLEDASIVLYIKGKLLELDVNAISIVGSRKLTSYGKEVTRMFVSELANLEITIVSGLARGIDTVAHKAANKDEEKIVKVLRSESLHLDEIARISGFHVSKVSARLTIMELKGLVINLGSGVYRKV